MLCTKCGQRFPVNPQTTRRVAVAQPATHADADLLPTGVAAAPPATPAGGVSAIDRAAPRPVRRSPEPARPASPPPAVPRAVEETLVEAVLDEDPPGEAAAPRGGGFKIAFVAVTVLLVLALIGGGVMLVQRSALPSPETLAFNSPDSSVTLVRIDRVPEPVWEPSTAALRKPSRTAPVRFENQTMVKTSTGQVVLQGRIELDSFEIYEGCTLNLALIDNDGNPFAQAHVPLMLLNTQKPRDISVEVPPDMYQKMQTLDWNVEVSLPVTLGSTFEQVVSTPSPLRGGHTALQITTYNTLTRPISRALFLITAYNAHDQAQGRWTTSWAQPVDARQRIEFAVVLPMKQDSIARWEIIGAGVVDDQP
ncbi:MAG: hypothetical protein K8S99_17895 [Planctomycetes bacterium]|nr:hypothetical protein [Planctomycetota bacterium]